MGLHWCWWWAISTKQIFSCPTMAKSGAILAHLPAAAIFRSAAIILSTSAVTQLSRQWSIQLTSLCKCYELGFVQRFIVHSYSCCSHVRQGLNLLPPQSPLNNTMFCTTLVPYCPCVFVLKCVANQCWQMIRCHFISVFRHCDGTNGPSANRSLITPSTFVNIFCLLSLSFPASAFHVLSILCFV